MTALVELTLEDLEQIASEVWTSYFDPTGEEPLVPIPAASTTVHVTASVSVTGAWHGHVAVSCSAAAADQLTAALLGVDRTEVSEDDITDALGELANVFGGNVKSLLPGPCELSLPHVVIGAGTRWPATTEVCYLQASWLGEAVEISVLQSTTTNHHHGLAS